MQLWNWIDVTYGRPQQTGLLISNQDDEWTKTKLTDVGIDRNTIRRFHGLLMRINRARQNPHQPIQVWTKFMKQITFPRLLADIALKEMQSPTYVFPVGGVNAGQPDLGSAVTAFEEIWQSIYDKGIEIKPQKAPEPPGPPSGRVDGMALQIQGVTLDDLDNLPSGAQAYLDTLPNQYKWTGLGEAELH